MWQSLRISHLVLRISLGAVFLWFGLDKFFDPGYWLTAWVPLSVVHLGALFHISGTMIVYVFGVLELLIGISLISKMFVEFFALLGAIFLISISFFYGFNEIVVRDFGLVGGLVALAFWPSQRFRSY